MSTTGWIILIFVVWPLVIIGIAVFLAKAGHSKSAEEQRLEDEEQIKYLRNWSENRNE